MASALKKNVDHQANQNNKFLHLVCSNQLAGFDVYSCGIHHFVCLQGVALKNQENSIDVCSGLPLFPHWVEILLQACLLF